MPFILCHCLSEMFKFELQHPSLHFRFGTSEKFDCTQSSLLFFFFPGKFCLSYWWLFFFFNAHMQMHKHSMCNQRSPKKYTDVKWKLSQSSKCLKNTQMLDRIQINHLAHQLCFFFSSSCWVLWKDNLVLCLKLNKEKAVTWVLLVLQKSFPIL